MARMMLVAAFAAGLAGAARADGEGYATTGDWREVKVAPAVGAPAQTAPPRGLDFAFNGPGRNGAS